MYTKTKTLPVIVIHVVCSSIHFWTCSARSKCILISMHVHRGQQHWSEQQSARRATLCCQWCRNHGGAGGWRPLTTSAKVRWHALIHMRTHMTLRHIQTEQTVGTDVLCCRPVSCSARIDVAEIDRLILWPTNFSVLVSVFLVSWFNIVFLGCQGWRSHNSGHCH